ncbi:MAG TPA: DUF4142 domain-containing protein, partial [Casimicrobiaceae bacterium]
MSHQLTARRILVASVVVAASACSRFRGHSNPGGRAPAPSRPTATAPTRKTPAKNAPTDANIAAILLAANNTDISYAKLVAGRSASPAIKDFANRMLIDHGAVNTAVTELIARTQIQPADNQASLDFRDESTARRDVMRELNGRRFDSTYIANEIAYHNNLLQ